MHGIALDAYEGDGQYLIGPWRVWDRQVVESVAQPTNDLGEPTDERGNLLLHDPRELFVGGSRIHDVRASDGCRWVIVVGPYGQRGPMPSHPRGADLEMHPAGRRAETARADFVAEFPGAYDMDFLLYEGRGAVPAWNNDAAELAEADGPPVPIGVLEHIDAVAAAVREIRLTEPSPIEDIFFDGLLDQLEVLREHMGSDEPTPRPRTVLRYLAFVRDQLRNASAPSIAEHLNMITQALTEILRLAG